jgi:hypothetical protein
MITSRSFVMGCSQASSAFRPPGHARGSVRGRARLPIRHLRFAVHARASRQADREARKGGADTDQGCLGGAEQCRARRLNRPACAGLSRSDRVPTGRSEGQVIRTRGMNPTTTRRPPASPVRAGAGMNRAFSTAQCASPVVPRAAGVNRSVCDTRPILRRSPHARV